MDSPAATRFFRHFFHHGHHRRLASRRPTLHELRSSEPRWHPRSEVAPSEKLGELRGYPWVTARELRGRKDRPRRVRMLLREFIEDSLYNPHYGYFSKQAVIFTPGKPFDFNEMRDEPQFYRELGRRYTEFEDYLDATEGLDETRQLWHTPTELFRPHYGRAVAEYLVSNYRLTTYPYEDLIIYEMGAGRGTLMLNILDWIREVDPDVYARTRFRVVEISPALAAMQRKHLAEAASAGGAGHGDRVEIINRSIFDWTEYSPSPCFFLAMEVVDNFAHDAIAYDLSRPQPVPLQSTVVVDGEGDFFEFYQPALDPIAARYLQVRRTATDGHHPTPYMGTAGRESDPARRYRGGGYSSAVANVGARLRSGAGSALNALRFAMTALPGMQTISVPEYVPTRTMQFFDVLEHCFPGHKLVMSDFHSLPNAIRGTNAPVVQTRYRRQTVPVTTPLVHQGYFDILFPTNFEVMEQVYRAITGKLTRVESHEEFMGSWAHVEATQTKSGESPLLGYYKNASMMMTV